jgi:spore coat protein U-like protein
MPLSAPRRRRWSARGLTLGLVLLSVCAHAITVSCTATASSIVFGTYNPLSTTGLNVTGSWAVNCTAAGTGVTSVAGTVTLSTGSGTFATRTMRSGVNILNYNVYTTPSDTQVFGNGTASTGVFSVSGIIASALPVHASGSMYGVLPPLQNVAAGAYTDTLSMTVTY